MIPAESLNARALPANLDAEKAVLGSVLAFGDRFPDAAEHVEPRHFFRHGHQAIFRAMQVLAEARTAIDYLTVRDALTQAGALEDAGGPAYLTSLTDGVPRSANVADYARIVRQKARLRDLITAATHVLHDAYDAEDDAEVVLDRAEQTLFALSQGKPASGFTRLSEILPDVMAQIEVWCQTKQGVSGVATGFHELDKITRGLQPGNLIIVAARPAMGKSAFVVNVAQHVAKAGKTVAVFSLEMSERELAIRTLTAEARMDGHRLQRGFVRNVEWAPLSQAMSALSGLNLFIDDSPFVNAFEMRSRARRLKAQHGLDLLIVDYTQLMIGHEHRENRTLELASITRALKALAKDLEIPVIALSQLSRRVEERADKRPMLSDLRESGSLEQDADLVLFIFRESVYKETPENARIAEFIIGKQRNGPIGTVRLGWIPEQTKFVNLSELHTTGEQR